MDPKVLLNEKKDLSEAAKEFAEDFVMNGDYPKETSDIEISVYSVPGRDVL